MGMRCYLIVVLMCISLMIRDVEHLFISFIAYGHLYIFFGEMSIQVLCPSLIELGFVLPCFCGRYPCVLIVVRFNLHREGSDLSL